MRDDILKRSSEPVVLTGVGASMGIVIGRAFLVEPSIVKVTKRVLEGEDVQREVLRFEKAIEASSQQLEQIRDKVPSTIEEPTDILKAHQLILSDDLLVQGTIRRIQDEAINAEWALKRTVAHFKSVFDNMDDEYFRQRSSDLEFVGDRIMRNLMGMGDLSVMPPADAVVVARDLSPADTIHMYRAAVAALVTEAGGHTSHTALVARAFEIPAVVGIEDGMSVIRSGDLLIVDGQAGLVICNPTPDTISAYRLKSRRLAALEEELLRDRDLKAVTIDGITVRMMANVELPDEVPSALEHGAEGVGLYRTEYCYLDREQLPTEQELMDDFQKVLVSMDDLPVTFRTFDLGGDKASRFFKLHKEANPALGLRSTRLALKERAAFKTHLRALIRSVNGGELRIMFPMISDLSELRKTREVLSEAMAEVEAEGLKTPAAISVGVMMELPSACVLADLLAKEVDFFSIGTNDLIQYSMAIDRVNEHVAHLYHPLHPSILRFMKKVADAAHENGIEVAICGAMSQEPMFTLVLLGLGIDELSMPALAIPFVKRVIRRASHADAERLVSELLSLETVEEIESAVTAYMNEHFKEEVFDPDLPQTRPSRKEDGDGNR